MITAELPKYLGTVIFCDDVRTEVGGKLSYIGIYKGFMGIHGIFPITLPKFCFAVSFWLSKKTELGTVRLWIFMPGDSDDKPSIEGEFDPTSAPRVAVPESPDSTPAEYARSEMI